MENQQVRMLARKYDAQGTRTVGVLTKADLLPQGAEAEWLQVLLNSRYALKHGFFAVRNPPQVEIDSAFLRVRACAVFPQPGRPARPWRRIHELHLGSCEAEASHVNGHSP